MSFSQWGKYLQVNSGIYIQYLSPILASSSLCLEAHGIGQATYTTPLDASGLAQGLERGKLRTLFKLTLGGSNTCGFGIVCMGSLDDLVNNSGAFYRYELRSNSAYTLSRATTSSLSADIPGTTLASSTQTVTLNVAGSMEMEWIADITNLGGVYLVTRKGTATDFSDMTVVTQMINTGAGILTTSSSEGLYLRAYGSASPGVRTLFNSTQLYEMI